MRTARFFLVWALVGVLYLAGVLGYRLSVAGSLPSDPRTILITLAGALIVSLMLAIPTFLFWSEVRLSSTVRSMDGQIARDPERSARSIRHGAFYVRLWIIFVILATTVPSLVVYKLHVERTKHKATQAAATSTTPLVQEPAAPEVPREEEPADPSTLPRFGALEKTPDLVAADEAFVAGIIERAGSREEALRATLAGGWQAYQRKEYDAAMRRFNQAWLIASSSSEALRGMSAVEQARGNLASAAELAGEEVKREK